MKDIWCILVPTRKTVQLCTVPFIEQYRSLINPQLTRRPLFQELEFRNFTLDVGRMAAMRRQAARRWRSRHLCSAITVVLVLVMLVIAGALIAWLWTADPRLFRGVWSADRSGR